MKGHGLAALALLIGAFVTAAMLMLVTAVGVVVALAAGDQLVMRRSRRKFAP